MTFLNWSILAGLGALAIPLLVHLLNRRRAKVVRWGAMRFLHQSFASRNRRILLEEMLLLAMRCLLVALLVLAFARPFVPARGRIPWPIILPGILLAVVLAGLAGALWSRRLWRNRLLAGAGGLLTVAVVLSVIEASLQRRLWSRRGGAQDVVIVVDASRSMQMRGPDGTRFDRALAEARAAINAAEPDDAVTVLLAGATVEPMSAGPTSDRAELLRSLRTARPMGGTMQGLDSLHAAVDALARGTNVAKKIVVITDAQRSGWSLPADRMDAQQGRQDKARWGFWASRLSELPSRPEVIVRTIESVGGTTNLTVDRIELSRRPVGTDRPVGIDVTVANTGQTTVSPEAVQITVEGRTYREPLAALAAGGSQTVRLEHRFTRSGPAVVSARVDFNDDLPPDNQARRVVTVLQTLPVLIIEGQGLGRPDERPGRFLAAALAPPADAPDGGDLVAPVRIAAADVGDLGPLDRWEVIILADVPRLPNAFAAELERFVQGGGGLWVAPGAQAGRVGREGSGIESFYNEWTATDGQPLLPARLVARDVRQSPARPAPESFSHAALTELARRGLSDLAEMGARATWRLEPLGSEHGAGVGARLTDGTAWLVDRRVGAGRVLVSSFGLSPAESDLPARRAVVPLVHELVYWLARADLADWNIPPGREVAWVLPDEGGDAPARRWVVADPAGVSHDVTAQRVGSDLHVSFAATQVPGLYRLQQLDADGHASDVAPFVVQCDPAEVDADILAPGDLEPVSGSTRVFHARSPAEMVAALAGDVPGEELWKYFAIAALVTLLAELVITRWIAARRRAVSAQPVVFPRAHAAEAALRRRFGRSDARDEGAKGAAG